ncbi:(2Fe-2S)-binding protein [Streptomyces albofaciens JCM 4342]|uniref:(2Fe-2S)-binding protein n=1 Tax=Streptomyces albofaciens TaxID=66866 RepID=UPI001238C7FE|nr:(2Fe-2S)-binding protein [Streptomyces albofaciens]KAA6221634.1 (2Fe-2S)-binding protein [Streptomyces albofaciens JCM 4342]
MSAQGEAAAQDGPLAALAALAAHGPRYRLGLGAPPPGAPGWLAADRLLDPYGPELSHLLDTEHRGSGHRTAHAAALTLIAVYAGRVTAAAVLHWALTGRVLDVRPGNVWLRPDPGHGIAEVRLRAFRMLDEADGPDERETTVQHAVLTQHLLPLADALRERTRAGLRQLRGGVAHGCATALGASRAAPELLARRWSAFLDGAPGGLAALGDVATVTRSDGTRRLVYLRRTCCLFHTSAEAVRCASCCLTSREARIAAYEGRS